MSNSPVADSRILVRAALISILNFVDKHRAEILASDAIKRSMIAQGLSDVQDDVILHSVVVHMASDMIDGATAMAKSHILSIAAEMSFDRSAEIARDAHKVLKDEAQRCGTVVF